MELVLAWAQLGVALSLALRLQLAERRGTTALLAGLLEVL